MFLVELVMQGVRGFRQLARLRFQSGFNFVAAGNEAGKTTAVDTMQRLLFPSSRPELISALLSKQTPDSSRGALVMFSGDNAYYRIIQDFSKQGVNLSKYDAGKKDFTLMHKEWDNAVAFMQKLTAGMSEDDFARVFVFRRDHYAAQSGPAVPAPAAVFAPVAQPSRPTASAGKKTSADQARLAELRESLKKAEEAADAEYKAQSAKLAMDEVKKKLTTLEEVDQKKKDFESTLSGLKVCESLPENLSELIETYERLQGQRMTEAESLNKQLEGLRFQLANIQTVNLATDKFVLAGAGLGAVSIVAGMFFLTAEYSYLFPLGVLAAAAIATVGWYNASRKISQRKAIEKDMDALEKERIEFEKRFEQESAPIKACMKTIGAATPADLKEKAENYRYFLSLQEDIEQQHHRIMGDNTLESLQEEYNKRQQDALELEKAARVVAQYNIDTYAIRQDIDRIEGKSSSGPGAAWDYNAEVQDLPSDFAMPVETGRQAGIHTELGIASRIGGIELETLIPAVEAAAQRNLAAVTSGKYVRVEMGQNGEKPVVHTKDDMVVHYEDQSHGTRDLVYFCLRTGLVEALVGKLRLPVLLDDPLAGFDAVRQKAACQVLRGLGAKTQVILFCSNPALKVEGDASSELK